MKALNKFFFPILLLAIFSSCDDILEEDISNDMVATISPAAGEEIYSNVISFKWKELDGADKYRLQVLAGGESVVLDSLVSSTNFTYSLSPGTYQWRVRGENFAYKTDYTFPQEFTLIETDDLTNQQVLLIGPQSGTYTNQPTLTFSWTPLTAAQYYDFELVNVTNGNITVHQETDITTTYFTLPSGVISLNAQYIWKVKAVNPDNDTETQFATSTFYVDTNLPNQPQNSSPVSNGTADVNAEVTFNWTVANESGPINSPVKYTVQIATNSAFSNIIYSSVVTTTSLDYTFTNAGTYYWRVKSTDQAGNESGYSTYFKLVIE